MEELTIIEDHRENKKEPVTKGCTNCGNFQTCTIRTSMPNRVFDMSTHRPFTLPEQFVPPMACGGELWREIEQDDATNMVKLEGETWKQFYARRDAARSKPQLTELP